MIEGAVFNHTGDIWLTVISEIGEYWSPKHWVDWISEKTGSLLCVWLIKRGWQRCRRGEAWIPQNPDCTNTRRRLRGNLPRFVSVFAMEVVAHGQKPLHMMFRSLPVRQACCSSLHCKKREREREREMQVEIFMGVTAGKKKKREIAHSDETVHLEKGSKNELSFSAAFSCKVRIKKYT